MLLGGGAEPEAPGNVDRHHVGHGRLALTLRSARSKIDKLAHAASSDHLNIEKAVPMATTQEC